MHVIKLVWFYNAITRPKDADELTNSLNPVQTAPSDQGICTLCSDVSVVILSVLGKNRNNKKGPTERLCVIPYLKLLICFISCL